MKKITKLLALILSAVFCLSLIGCSSGNDESDKIVVFTRDNPTEVATVGKMLEAFKEKKKSEGAVFDYDVRTISDARYNEDITKSIAAGTMADLVYVADEYLENLALRGVFENLDPYFANAGFDFTKHDAAAFEISKCVGQNGEKHLYMVPRTYDQILIAINVDVWKDILGENYEIPTADVNWTWTKLEQVMSDIRKAVDDDSDIHAEEKSTYFPIDLQLGWQPFYNSFIRSFGGYVYDAQTSTVGMTSARTVKAIEKLKDMLDKKYFEVKSSSSFYGKKSPMWLISRPSVTNSLKTDRGIDNLRFLPIPIYDDAFTGLTNGTSYYSYGSVGFAMYSKAKDKQLAYEYLEFTLSEQGQKIWAESGIAVPTLLSMQQDPNAEWTKHPSYITGIDQSAFTFNDYKKDYYERIPATYARTGTPSKYYETVFYTEARAVFGTPSYWNGGAQYFAEKAQYQLGNKVN